MIIRIVCKQHDVVSKHIERCMLLIKQKYFNKIKPEKSVLRFKDKINILVIIYMFYAIDNRF
jgi:hypothetical protein